METPVNDFSLCAAEIKFVDVHPKAEAPDINIIANALQSACYDVILKLLKVLVGGEPEEDDMKRMQFTYHKTDRTKTAVHWDGEYIGDLVPGLPKKLT